MERDSSQTSSTARVQPIPRESLKDTFESIIVALILAFVFRAFVVEAFVIPTGSMAPTLYGAHGSLVCADCGTEFAYGLRDLEDERQFVPVRAQTPVICPNCNHVNSNLAITDEAGNAQTGDRILVLKWPYDLGSSRLDPSRWEVVVFKDPSDGVTNFIKRLVGLPNEVLVILDGDIYAAPLEELSRNTRAALEDYRLEKHELTSGQKRGRLRPLPDAVLEELDARMAIQRKTPAAQRVLWTTVYNHNHPPRTPSARKPRWMPSPRVQSGWDAAERQVRFVPLDEEIDFIELTGKSFRAINAYNVQDESDAPVVSDHRVRMVWTPEDEAAVLHVRLGKHERTFFATFWADGRVRLAEASDPPADDDPGMAMTRVSPMDAGRPVKVAFENLDYRLAIQVGDDEVLASSDEIGSPDWYGPDVTDLRRREGRGFVSRLGQGRNVAIAPRLYGAGGPFTVTHLIVDRDVHYYHAERHAGLPGAPWAPRMGWGSSISPILLRGHEYFMLGDNTSASKDSRLWDEVGNHLTARGDDFQLGTVPRDQLIGRAFFVYWPSGHRLAGMPLPLIRNYGLIPDVGRMRWIR